MAFGQATSRSQWCAGNHHWDDTGKCCTAGGKWQGSYPEGGRIRTPLLSLTGNLEILRNDVSKDKILFSSEVLPLPRVFESFPFSRETVLQGACLGCREGTARGGSECLRMEFGGVSGAASGAHLPHHSWCVLSKHLLLHRTP